MFHQTKHSLLPGGVGDKKIPISHSSAKDIFSYTWYLVSIAFVLFGFYDCFENWKSRKFECGSEICIFQAHEKGFLSEEIKFLRSDLIGSTHLTLLDDKLLPVHIAKVIYHNYITYSIDYRQSTGTERQLLMSDWNLGYDLSRRKSRRVDDFLLDASDYIYVQEAIIWTWKGALFIILGFFSLISCFIWGYEKSKQE
eukprot:c19457_g2_i1.p1 GENE.c19457_g2_i1~~c19457_g2_i1.p1  ORF type:complete len:197 (-),score=49.63 c19457_g2_i1:29-619(-)